MSKFTGNIIRLPAVTPTQNSASGVYTLDDQFTAQSSGTWPIVRDQYFNYTTLLLTGAVQGTAYPNPVTQPYSFLSDASTNNFVVSPNGDVSARPFNPYLNNYSNYFNGSSGVNFANNAGFDFSTGDFTIESWVYIAGNSALDGSSRRYANIFSVSTTGAFNVNFVVRGDSTTTGTGLEIYNGTSTVAVTGSISQNAWNHVAVSRSGANAYFWLNGQQMGATQSISGSWGSSANAGQVGQSANTVGYSFPLIGYLSNVRVVKGRAVYTSAFTPSTTPLTRTSGGTNPPQGTECVLLTCQSNRFLDSNGPNVPASSPLTTTVSGSPAVSQNSPFVSYDTTNGSGYFDGTGDYLSVADNTALDMEASDFTMECWVYLSETPSSADGIFAKRTDIGTFGGVLIFFNGLTPNFYATLNGSSWGIAFSSSISATLNAWTHLAFTRSGNTWTIYVNGVSGGTGNSSGTVPNNTSAFVVGAYSSDGNATYLFPAGYISNVRVVKGTAITPPAGGPTAPLQAVTNTSLLTLQTRAPATNNGFIDSSSNNFVVTRNGNTTQGSFSPFSPTGWSNLFNGSNNGFTVPASSSFSFSGAFTWEAFVCFAAPLSSGGYGSIVMMRGANASSSSFQYFIVNSSGTYSVNTTISVGGTDYNSGWNIPTPTIGVWYHVAVVRDASNNLLCYWDGTQRTLTGGAGSAPGTTNTPSAAVSVAYRGNGYNDLYFNGYISNLRMVASALYSGASITIPTAAFSPTVANTRFLTCQSNRFAETAAGMVVTLTNTPSVQAFSPFAPAQSYIPSQIGGSGYFDGTTDYLTWTGTAAGSGAFCYEFWIYSLNGFGTMRAPLGVIAISGYNSALDIRMSSTTINLSQYNVANNNFTVPALQANTWYHVVACRDTANNTTVFVNGTRSSTGALTISTNFSGLTSAIGRLDPSNGGDVTGYISGVRLITGSTPYDPTQTTITVPAAPPTAIPNTSLLLNFTNGGIVDATGKNNLETVANSSVQTSQAKWSPGSMYFDGTGDYLLTPVNDLTNFGNGSFTVEGWLRINATGSFQVIYSRTLASTSGYGGTWVRVTDTNVLQAAFSSGTSAHDVLLTGTTTLTTGQWYHFAWVRSSNTFYLYLNGSQEATTTSSVTMYASGDRVSVGVQFNTSSAANFLNGYIDDLRISKGIARYTSNFNTNLPSGPFPLG